MTRGYLASLAQARADDLHHQEEEARANACQHDWKRIEGINGLDWQCSLCLEFSY